MLFSKNKFIFTLCLKFTESNTLRLAISTWAVSLLLSSSVFFHHLGHCTVPQLPPPPIDAAAVDADWPLLSLAQVPPANQSRALLLQPPARPTPPLSVENFSEDKDMKLLGLHQEQFVSETPSSSSYLYSLSSLSLETGSDTLVSNNESYITTTSHFEAENLRHPIPFSPLLAPVHLSLLLTGANKTGILGF
jgi:hypothetical protein